MGYAFVKGINELNIYIKDGERWKEKFSEIDRIELFTTPEEDNEKLNKFLQNNVLQYWMPNLDIQQAHKVENCLQIKGLWKNKHTVYEKGIYNLLR